MTAGSPRSSPRFPSSRPIAAPAVSTGYSSSKGCLTSPRASLDSTAPRSGGATSSRPTPSRTTTTYQDFAPLHYDSGDYGPVLDKALEVIGYRTFIAEEQPRLRAAGRRVGIGVVCYTEGTGIGPYEGARIQVQGSGRVLLA